MSTETEDVRAEEIEEVTGEEPDATTGLPGLDELFTTLVAKPDFAAIEACMRLARLNPALGRRIEAFVTAIKYELLCSGELDYESEEAAMDIWKAFVAGYESKAVDIPGVETNEPTPSRTFAAEKASGRLRRVVDWLASRDRQTKLAILLSHALLRNERNIQYEGNYDGNVGNEVLAAFERDVFEGEPMEGADEFVRGYALALDQIDG